MGIHKYATKRFVLVQIIIFMLIFVFIVKGKYCRGVRFSKNFKEDKFRLVEFEKLPKFTSFENESRSRSTYLDILSFLYCTWVLVCKKTTLQYLSCVPTLATLKI